MLRQGKLEYFLVGILFGFSLGIAYIYFKESKKNLAYSLEEIQSYLDYKTFLISQNLIKKEWPNLIKLLAIGNLGYKMKMVFP